MYCDRAWKSIKWKKLTEEAMALTWCALGTDAGSADLMKYRICCLMPDIEIVPPFSLLKREPDFQELVRERYVERACTGHKESSCGSGTILQGFQRSWVFSFWLGTWGEVQEKPRLKRGRKTFVSWKGRHFREAGSRSQYRKEVSYEEAVDKNRYRSECQLLDEEPCSRTKRASPA